MILDRKFTEEEISDIMHMGGICDDDSDEYIYTLEDSHFVSADREHGSYTKSYVIKDCSTGKLYMADLTTSDWHLQDEINADAPWYEVVREEVISYKYKLV